jgi:hypothetical protein
MRFTAFFLVVFIGLITGVATAGQDVKISEKDVKKYLDAAEKEIRRKPRRRGVLTSDRHQLPRPRGRSPEVGAGLQAAQRLGKRRSGVREGRFFDDRARGAGGMLRGNDHRLLESAGLRQGGRSGEEGRRVEPVERRRPRGARDRAREDRRHRRGGGSPARSRSRRPARSSIRPSARRPSRMGTVEAELRSAKRSSSTPRSPRRTRVLPTFSSEKRITRAQSPRRRRPSS